MKRYLLTLLHAIARLRTPIFVATTILIAIVAVGWISRGFVRAYAEVKTAHIFATNVVAQGWENPARALSLDLGLDAPLASFAAENAATVAIGEVPVPEQGAAADAPAIDPATPPAESEMPALPEAAGAAADEPSPSENPVQETPANPLETPAPPQPETPEAPSAPAETPAPPASEPTVPAPAPETAAPPAPAGPTSLIDVLRRRVAEALAVPVASATSSAADTASSTEPARTTPAEETPDASAASVAVCTVLQTPCYTIELSGFSVEGALTDKKFKSAAVSFSFASLPPEEGTVDDLLVVRYYHAGAWRQAGEVFLNTGMSNAHNGGYFTAALDGVAAWEDLSDLRVMIEYERRGTSPARLFLDAAWVDVAYQDRAQEVLLSDVPPPSDAPDNVAFDLARTASDKPHLLVFDDGSTLAFPYADTASPRALALRTDALAYVPDDSGQATAYVSITNTGKRAGTFTLAAAFSGSSRLSELSQYMRNVPAAASSTTYRDVTYFCESRWERAAEGEDSVCGSSGEEHRCAAVSDDGVNCTVAHVPVETAPETRYESGWVRVPLSEPAARGRAGLPVGYAFTGKTTAPLEIMPGQTIYLRASMESDERSAIRFILAATGGFSATLDSAKLALETKLADDEERAPQQKAPVRRAYLNEQLSDGNEFDSDAQPRFHFRFRSQRSFFARMLDMLGGGPVPFTVTGAKLVHASGEEERAPVGISYGEHGDWSLTVDKPPRAFRPGRYSVELTIGEGDAAYTDTVDFYWGVLAMNTDKQPYMPGDTAHLSLAALDDNGDTLCDAKLALTITAPSGKEASVPVSPGGSCGRNNITDIPDYVADYPVDEDGTYQVLLERLDADGAVIAATTDAFAANSTSTIAIRREGPTRIYPPSAYRMQLTVEAAQTFRGTLREVVPEGFLIADAGGASVTRDGGVQYLTWDVSLQAGATSSVAYQFKAPDVSPYLFLLGSATIADESGAAAFDEGRTWKIASDAVAIATGVAWLSGTTTTVSAELNNGSPTALSWNRSADYDTTYFSYSSSTPSQLTINQDGDYYVALTLPVERTDGNTRDTRVAAEIYVNGAPQPFAITRSSLITAASNHSEGSDHLAVLLRGLHAGDYLEVYEYSPNTVNANDHMIISGAASLYAEYVDVAQNVYFGVGTTTLSGSDLNTTSTSTVYWYDDATGRKDSNFTHSNSSVPGEITLAASGYYLVDVNIPLAGAVADANVRGRLLLNNTMVAGGDFKQGSISNTTGDAASSIHFSGVVYATTTNVKLSATVLREGAAGTLNVGSYQASLYVQQLPTSGLYAARTKALTGGTNWNVTPKQSASWTTDDLKDTNYFTHSTSSSAQNITVTKAGDYLLVYNDSRAAAVSRPNQIITVEVNGTAVTGAQTKSHFFENASGNTESSGSLTFYLRNLAINDVVTVSSVLEANTGTVPSDQDALLLLWYKAPQSPYIQQTQHWYANTNAQTPSDSWPAGATDIAEADPITSGVPVKSGDVLRLRMALQANVTTVAGADAFKLQYAAGSSCSPALAWSDVGAAGSGSIWRGYDNAGVSAGSTITSQLLSVSSTSETYEEQNPSSAAPNSITAGKSGEWDWVLQDNGADAGIDYCFRMVSSGGQLLKDYLDYPALTTNGTPDAPELSKLFDNEKVASTTPWFEFVSSDPNGEDIHYQVQVSTDPAFASTVIDKDSVTSFAQFTNIITTSDKAPFNSGETIRFAPTTALSSGTTYWWRVRAKDGAGTNTWSSWSSSRSFTVDTSVIVSTWFQTTAAQFDTDSLTNLATTTTGGGTVELSGSNTSGTLYSPAISYASKTSGNAWGTVTWSDTEVGGTLLYQVEYFASTSVWTLIPDSDLPGNSTGTTTAPINLSNLDTATYDTIRIKANFAKTSATPVLSDWTLSWALTVSAPTQSALFDDEKTGTTTPTFSFSATDPQGNDLVYQIQWSTDSTFATGVSSSTSSTGGSAFWNTSSSTDTSPFAQGATISFKIPQASALSNGTTYWWRVRAKDPDGGDAYSQWSSSRSFTVDTSVTVSTWFQTTTAQFLTDSIHKALAASNAVGVSSDTGKIAIYREATAGDAITTAAFFQNFDTTVRQDDIYSMSASTSIRLKQGHYAVIYGTRFASTGGTRRSEIQSYLNMASTSLSIGWSQGFITRASSANTAFTSGGGIIYAPADDTPLTIMSYRTDTNPTATLTRSANTSGVQLIRLDDNWEYVRLSKTAKQTGPTSATWVTVNYDREDELDEGSFSHAQGSGNVVLASPGHYLVFANTYGSLPTASTNETQVKQRLTLDGAEIDGSYTTVYMRGNSNSNGAYQGAAATGMIIQSTTTNQVLTVQVARAIGTAAWTINAGPTGTYLDRTGITVVKLPEGDFVRLRDSGTGNMNPASLTGFTWNTEDEKDASFTHSTVTNAARITTNVAGDYLFLGGLYAQVAGVTGGVYRQGWRKNGGTELQYGQAGGLSVNTTTADDGNWAGVIVPSMVNTDYVELTTQATGAAGTMSADKKGVQGVRIASLAEGDTDTPTVESPDIDFSDGSGPKWSTVSRSATTPGSSSIIMQVLYASSTAEGGYALVPDADLAGNSSGTTSASFSIAGLSRLTYPTLRLRATLDCVSGSCPTLNDWTLTWSAGITISGTAKQYDESTNVTSGTVAVAVNGVLQAGKTGTISGGTWSIPNVTAFTGDVITVFVQGAAAGHRAVAVTAYTTDGDITGMKLYENHLVLGSDDHPLLSNADLGQYDNSVAGSSDLFHDVSTGNSLTVCTVTDCFDSKLTILSGTTYRPDSASGGSISMRHLDNQGVFIADGNAISLTGSWKSGGIFVAGTSAVTFAATSTTETIDTASATSTAFSTVIFGSGSGTATWNLQSPLNASSTVSVNYGTLAQNGAHAINLSGSLSIGSAGAFSKGTASTTFMGSGSSTWTDSTASKQDMGLVVIDGSAKSVSLGSAVKATDIVIGSDDTLSAGSSYGISVGGNWRNDGAFTAQSGTVTFTATAPGKVIAPGASSFYGLTFSGTGGNWSFSTSTVTVADTLTITAGSVTLPSATTTVGGSFTVSGGSFAHNNGVVLLTSSASKTVQAGGSSFYDLTFDGSGSWSFVDTNATSSRHVTMTTGTVTLPSGTLAVGGSFLKNGGSFNPNGGTLRFFATSAQTVRLAGTSAANLTFDGVGGSWVFGTSAATTTGTVRFDHGAVTLPSGSLAVGGSFLVTGGSFSSGTSLVRFVSSATGNTIDPASSAFYDVELASGSGGWTIAQNATTTRHFTLSSATSFTLASGKTLSVGGTFTNLVGGAATTWTGSILYLASGGSFTLDTKTQGGDAYGTLALAGTTKVKMWNSSASGYVVPATASLYSMNHAAVSGALSIWGTYANTGNEYWSYATDFDGTALGVSSRAVAVRIASGSSVTIGSGAWSLTGSPGATTTIANQGSGTYALALTGGSLSAQYYSLRDLGASGFEFSGTPTVTSLSDGDIEVSSSGGSGMTIAASVITQNPALQIQRMRFATTTAISAVNVTESGTPSSYWWFRNHTGNLAGESYDSDPGGNPGYVRFDDSGYDIAVSGHVYADHGATALGAPCDGTTQNVKLVVDYGASTYTASCNASTGAFSFPSVQFVGDVTLTAFLDTGGGAHAVTVTRTPTANITDLDLYRNAVIVRHEDLTPLSIASMARYDQSDDADITFSAATSTTDTLTVRPDTELVVWTGKTFAPGGNVTLDSGGSGSLLDGRLYLLGTAAFTATGTETHTIGGSLYVGTSSTFTAGSSSVVFAATTTGKTIYAASPLSLYDLTFSGSGGAWALVSMAGATTTVTHALALNAGTLSGTGDLVVQAGSLSGSGTVAMTGGAVLLQGTGSLGNANAWQFYDLTFSGAASTTKAGAGTTTVSHVLTVGAGTKLSAGSAPWVLTGGGTPFVRAGTFYGAAAPFTYSAASATNIADAAYGTLALAPSAAGSPTYTILGGTLSATSLAVGDGTHPVTVTADTNDPALDIGDIDIRAGGTLVASNVGAFDVSGNWTDAGTFTPSAGGVRFVAAATGKSITAGGSSFYDLTFASAAGGWTMTDSATTTHDFTLQSASSFTKTSGTSLAVQGTFTNLVGGAATTWAGSTLFLSSGTSYSANTKSASGDTYGTLLLGGSTHVRLWNSGASSIIVPSNASLYSMNHGGASGALNIYGSYARTSGSDYWSYATDFDGTDISLAPRQVAVAIASSSSVSLSGGLLDIIGSSAATTTIDNQGSGFYAFSVSGGTVNASYFSLRHANQDGLNLSGTPTVSSLSHGDFELSYPDGALITVASSVITANPLKIFQYDRFATSTGIASGVNVKATGSTASSWKFNLHHGAFAGESYDSDPGGDPGYIRWDDSASAITIAGHAYADEGVTVSPACDGSTQSVKLVVEGSGTFTSSCNASTGAYAIPGVTFNPGDTLTLYLDGVAGRRAANVSVDPVSSIGNMDLYENRVIVRHEDTSPITIADMTVYDSSDDADIPFTAVDSGTDTLTLPPDTKLIVWSGKTFAPAGNVTLSSGGSGHAWDGTLELQGSAVFSAAGTQSHAIGGSLVLGTGASIVPASASFTFTATTTGKTLDFGASGLFDATFNGSGGNWAFSTSSATILHDLSITTGSVTLPTATTTIGGSFADSGSFAHNNGTVVFSATTAGKTITAGSSPFHDLRFDGAGGGWSFTDTAATSSGSVVIAQGTVTLPSRVFAVGGSFTNAGTFVSGTGTIRFTSATTGRTITTGGSNPYAVVFDGPGGSWTWSDAAATTTRSFEILNGSTTLPARLSVGGSFTNAGTFTAGSGTVALTATTTGFSITAGGSSFYDLTFASAAGGWTMTDSATTTHDFTLQSASSFTKTSGTSLAVQGTFTNLVGGAATTWAGSTLFLSSGTSYSANTKSASGDTYGTLLLGGSTHVRLWNSGASSIIVPSNASLYSMNHGGASGALNIYGSYARTSGSDYWSYATDFDGVALGSPRAVTVSIGSGGAVSYSSSASLDIIGGSGATTTVQNQGSGSYSFSIAGASLSASRYAFRNLDATGLSLSGSPVISSLSDGDFEVSASGGSAITVAGSAIDANASAVYTGIRFATTTAISATNVTRTGSPVSAWSFQNSTGNLAGEGYDSDGGDACGAIRWPDSTCLFVSQEHYRFRADDGGIGVPDSEWYSASWSKRKTVVITNPDPTSYTDLPVKLVVDYDSDMRSDFGDLRFTDDSGTTSISYWKESTLSSASTTVWVKVPSLPASGSATVYLYYGNAGATASDSSGTFGFLEDFESGSLSGYSGNTSLFHVGTSFNHNHTYGLDAGSNVLQQTTQGLYKTGTQTAQGDIIRYYQYVDSSQQDEPCTFFGVQGQGQNYAVCLDEYPSHAIEIVKNVTSNDGSGTELASTTVTFTTGWYEVVIDWLTNDDIDVTVYDATGAVFATLSTNDSSYTSGGVGFGFWGQHGGWDFYSVRPYVSSAPSYSIGSEQVSGGASWAADEDTPLPGVFQNENVRIRFSVHNTGAVLSSRHFRVQVAPKGASLNCESVPYVNYADVPTDTAGCGSAVACMKTTSHYADATPIGDLLSFPSSLAFVAGYAVEDPSNQTSAITVPSYGATEAEYALQFTTNATGNAYCLRTSDGGASLDNYQHVAEVVLLHAPQISGLALNGDSDIALTEGATTTIYASATVSDGNGYADIVNATSSVFRSGVGALCLPDDNDCYQVASSSCAYSSCAGTSCTLTCRADLQFIADPTDAGSAFEADDWLARVFLADSTGLTALATSAPVDVLTLRGLRIDTPAIDFGSLSAGSDTGAVNAQTTFVNTGNTPIGIEVSGTDLAGSSGSIPVGEQKFATTTFAYGSCSVCQFLTGSATNVDITLGKPTATTTEVSGDIYWGLNVPLGTDASLHTGTNTFMATAP